MPAHVQLGVHSLWDELLHSRDSDRRDGLSESMRRIYRSHERRRGRLHQLPGERVDMPAHVQLGVHSLWDELLHSSADRRDVLSESMRRIYRSHERRRWRLHQLPGELVDMPAHVQLGVHSLWDELLHSRDSDRRDGLSESMRRIYRSHERRRGRLHQLPGERVDMPAHVQLGVHSLWDELLHSRDSDRRDVHTQPNFTVIRG